MRAAVGFAKTLVKTPQGVEPPRHFTNQFWILAGNTLDVAQIIDFIQCCESHSGPLFPFVFWICAMHDGKNKASNWRAALRRVHGVSRGHKLVALLEIVAIREAIRWRHHEDARHNEVPSRRAREIDLIYPPRRLQPHAYYSLLADNSPPFRVTRRANSRISIESLIQRTEPSPMQKLAPPEWKEYGSPVPTET